MLYIRTDMNDYIATGHVMRCLSIAQAAADAKERVLFLFADEQAVDLVQKRGFEAVVLHTRWDHMEEELEILHQVINSYGDGVLLIDSYMASPRYLQILSKWIKTAYIDDLGTNDYPAHVLICYAGYWSKFHYAQRYRNAKLLLGTQYAPLSGQYQNMAKKEIRPRLKNILLLSGGTDRFGILSGLLEQLCKKREWKITAICGAYDSQYDALCLQYNSYANIQIKKAVTNMSDYMRWADAAVSAGGTALYELCACGTPAVSYSFADNQLDNVRYFQAEDLFDYAGDVRDTNIFAKAALLLEQYDSQYEQRVERSGQMRRLVDAQGAARIARELAAVCQPGKENGENE